MYQSELLKLLLPRIASVQDRNLLASFPFFFLNLCVLQTRQLVEHFLAVSFGLNFAIDPPYDAIGPDNECVASSILLTLKLGNTAILGSDDGRFIRQKFEIEPFFGTELFVRVAGIKTYAQDHRILRLILCFIALEVVRLNRASLRKIF